MWIKYLQIKKMEHNKTFESEQTFLMKFHQLLLKNKCLYSIPALRNFVGAFKYERKKGMVTFHSLFFITFYVLYADKSHMLTLSENLHYMHNFSRIRSPS